MRASAAIHIVGIVLAACGDPRGGPSPREFVDGMIGAINRGEHDVMMAGYVSPAQLATLVDCTGIDAPWLTAADRQADLVKVRARFTGFFPNVRLLSMTAEDRDTEWHRYARGDKVGGSCTARAPFAIEKYRVALRIERAPGDVSEPSKPLEMWRVDGRYYLWRDLFD